jgi:hypothetical protein
MTTNNASKYVITLLITVALFGTAFTLSNYFNNKKTQSIERTADQISIELLSSETQFDILKESSCDQLSTTVLTEELGSLGSQLNYMEGQLGSNNSEVLRLKKYYSILQIKDYLLAKQYSAKCKTTPISILYFYSNDCDACTKEGYVLTYMRDNYPDLRVYSFDSKLDLTAVQTLVTVNKINEMPALVINDKTYNGFMETEELEKIVAPYFPKATSTATSTKATTTKR